MIDHKPNWTALLLSLMMVMVPAMGVPHEAPLQDTLKSMVVSFFALAGTFSYFCRCTSKIRRWPGTQ